MSLDHLLGLMRCAIFDVDGTLIDSLDIWNQVDVNLAHELGLPLISPSMIYELRESTLRQFSQSENPYVAWCRLLGEMAHSSKSPTEIHELRYALSRRALAENVRYREGATDFVKALIAKGVRCALATTTRRANITVYSQKNEVMKAELPMESTFYPILTREDVASTKPDPEVYTLALHQMGCAPFETVAFEDTLEGVQSAKAAGIPVIAIRESHSKEHEAEIRATVDAFVETYDELMKALPR